jgi:hypothetical protein
MFVHTDVSTLLKPDFRFVRPAATNGRESEGIPGLALVIRSLRVGRPASSRPPLGLHDQDEAEPAYERIRNPIT